MGRERDNQRSKLYAAESAIQSLGERYDSIEDLQAYVDRLVSLKWFQRRWAMDRIDVADGRRRRRACGGMRFKDGRFYGLIKMPRWSRTQPVVLHEVAHCCADFLDDDAAAHGWRFAKIFLELVRHELGDQAWKDLSESFKEHRVRWRKPRQMSPEAKAAATQRLRAHRR